MIVDAHVHLYPPEIDCDPAAWAAAAGERHWAVLCTRKRRDGRPVQSLPSVRELLAAMDAAGVDRAVLLGWYWEKPETCVWQNRFFAECVRAHPDRLSGCAAIHPGLGRDGARAEVRRAYEEGLRGLGELSPQSQGYAIDDPVFAEVLALAGDLRLPVNVHVTDPASRPYPGKIETPAEEMLRLCMAHPQTTFVLAHWGGMFPLHDVRFRALANVYYDTAASPLMYDAGVWQRLLPVLGAERVLFGSDYPLNLYPKQDEKAGMRRLVEEARNAGMGAAVLGGNARTLFGF